MTDVETVAITGEEQFNINKKLKFDSYSCMTVSFTTKAFK